MKYDILLLVIAAVLLLLIINGVFTRNDTVFLCATYFDCPKRDGWSLFQNGINTILELHDPQTLARIDKWIVVNDYSEKPRANWTKLMREQYPFITFLQKGEQDKGQAKSLNILLPYITSYTYWLHWEEGWVPTRPFIQQAFHIVDTTDITQLQFTTDFKRLQRVCKDDYCIIPHSKDIDDNLGAEKISTGDQMKYYWPLYSLQPSLNRVSFYDFGDFSTKTFKPPIMSEYDFAERWYRKGGVKGIFKESPLKRPDKYVSTHD